MKLLDLKSIIFSQTGSIQLCVVYDRCNNVDLENGCSVEYAYKHYGEREIHNVSATYEDKCAMLVFSIV